MAQRLAKNLSLVFANTAQNKSVPDLYGSLGRFKQPSPEPLYITLKGLYLSGNGSPVLSRSTLVVSAIANAVRWAAEIMSEIDHRWPDNKKDNPVPGRARII
jgi:hypothetical protein